MTTPPLILLTNDDGIASPGLRAAVEAVFDLGEVLVVAPLRQQTAASRSFPPRRGEIREHPVRLSDGREVAGWAVDGSPAQAVRWGILALASRQPDLLISGINYGENIGMSVTISGTIGAAIEGATFGVPGLAASLEVEDPAHHLNHSEEVDFSTAGFFLRQFARVMLRADLPPDVDILKLDVPADATPATPWRVTRLSRQRVIHSGVHVENGQRVLKGYYRAFDHETLEPDSDVYALLVDRVVSLTPLSIDLTARVDRNRLQADLGALWRKMEQMMTDTCTSRG